MTKVIIDCGKDVDWRKVEEQLEKALQKATTCKFKYLEEVERRLNNGSASTWKEAASQLGEITGEKPSTIERRVRLAKAQNGKPSETRRPKEIPTVGKFIFNCSMQIYQLKTKISAIIEHLDDINKDTLEPLITSLVELLKTLQPLVEKVELKGIDYEKISG